ncbi:hypothetical protein [Phocaeicola sp.]
MKTFLFIVGILICSLEAVAQKYLLPEFKLCVATAKQGSQPIQAKFNYNCVAQSMEFLEGDDIIKLSPISHIDTLYLDTHKMIPYGNHFLDVVYTSPKFSLLVDYKRKIVNEGKAGAMGLKTQGNVENIDFSAFGGRHSDDWKKGIDVWECKDQSTYVYVVKSKMKRFNNKKTLIKIFPDKAQKIEEYTQTKGFDFANTEEVLKLVTLCTE